MSIYDDVFPLTFTRHTRGLFSWVTSCDWPRDDNRQVLCSIELAEENGWRSGKDLSLGQFRFRIIDWDGRSTLRCYRDSGPREESVRKVLFITQHLAQSFFRNIGPFLRCKYQDWKHHYDRL